MPPTTHSRTQHARSLPTGGSQQPEYDCIRPAYRVEHMVLGIVVDDVADLEFVGHVTGRHPKRERDYLEHRHDVHGDD